MIKLLKDINNLSDFVSFDGVHYVLNQIDFGFASIKHYTTQGYKQIGTSLNGSLLGDRDITIHGFIIQEKNTKPSITSLKRRLQSVVGYNRFFYILVDDTYYIEAFMDGSIEYAAERYKNNDQLAEFQITAIAHNPTFYSLKEKVYDISYWSKNFTFPFTDDTPIIFGEKQGNVERIVRNDGDIETGALFSVYANGNVINPFIRVDNVFVKINTALSAGDILIISTGYGNKYITLNGENILHLASYDSGFPQIYADNNLVSFGAESGSSALDIKIRFKERFLEV